MAHRKVILPNGLVYEGTNTRKAIVGGLVYEEAIAATVDPRFINPASTAGGDGTTNNTTGADRAYVGMVSWESNEQGSLPQQNIIARVTCEEGVDTEGKVTIDGWSTGPLNYIDILTTAAGATNGLMRANDGTGYSRDNSVVIRENFVRIDGIEVDHEFDRAIFFDTAPVGDTDVRISNVLAFTLATGSEYVISAKVGHDLTLTNCLFVGNGRGGDFRTSGVIVDHCGFAVGGSLGMLANTPSTVTNTWIIGATTQDFWPGSATGSHNASEDATASTEYPTGSLDNIVPADEFENPTLVAATFDYSLKSGGSLDGAGTGSLLLDMVGNPYPSPSTIGPLASTVVELQDILVRRRVYHEEARGVFTPAVTILQNRLRFLDAISVVLIELTGSLSGAASLNAALTTGINLAGSVDGEGSLDSDLTTGIQLAGNVLGEGSIDADLTTGIQLSGSVLGEGSLNSDLTTEIILSGSVAGRADLSGSLTTQILLSSAATGQATLSADLVTEILLAGLVSGEAQLSADLTVGATTELSGAVTGSASLSAELSETLLAASVQGEAALSAALTTAIQLAGSVTGSARLTGDLTVGAQIQLSGAVTGTATLTADLVTQILLAGALKGEAFVAGELTIPIPLAGSVTGSGSITAELTTGINLSGSLSGEGVLTGLLISEGLDDVIGLITIRSTTPMISTDSTTPSISLKSTTPKITIQ